jgi:hypothetical protein
VPKTRSRRLVLDASLMRAAGTRDATSTDARQCIDFLISVRRICHRIFLTPEIEIEWLKHRSNVASDWIVSMTKIQKVDYLKSPANDELRLKIQEAASESSSAIMLKDIHLIEAALLADRIIISLDDQARRHFALVSSKIKELLDVIWISPKDAKPDPIGWLERGAPSEKRLTLGYSSS